MTEKWIAVIFCLFLTLNGSIDCTKREISTDTTGVCNKISSYMQSYQETYVDSHKAYINKPCSIFGMRTCTDSITAYRVGHRTTYRTAYRTSYTCCEGWKPTNDACEPVCVPQCSEDSKCVGLNICEVSSEPGLHVKQQHKATRLKRQDDSLDNSGVDSTTDDVPTDDVPTDDVTTDVVMSDDADGDVTSIIHGTEHTITAIYPPYYNGCNAGLGCCPKCANNGSCSRNSNQQPYAYCQCKAGFGGNSCQHKPGDLNLLLENTANQSSTYSNSPSATADKAVDGNLDGTHGMGSCMHSVRETNPWWMVDMGTTQCVGTVNVFNRVDCCRERLDRAIVRVGPNSERKRNAMCGMITTDQITADQKIELTCNLTGRYLSIEINGNATLQLCEVEAFEGQCEVLEPQEKPCPRNKTEYAHPENMTITLDEGPGANCSATRGREVPVGSEIRCDVYGRINGTCTYFVTVNKAKCPSESNTTMVGTLSWPETDAQTEAESNERCPVNTEGRNMGLGRRQCIFDKNAITKAVWYGYINKTICGEERSPDIDELAKIPITEDNVREVADAVANIPLQDSPNKDIDIEAITDAILNVINVRSPDPEVTEAVIVTIGNILDAVVPKSDNAANASSMLLKAIDEQIARTLEEYGQFKSTQPNIAVEGVTVNKTSTSVGFGISRTGSDISNTNITYGSNDTKDSGSYIQLPRDALGNSSDTQVSFIGYNDEKLFQSNITTENVKILTPIISAAILGKKVTGLKEQVIVKITPSLQNMDITINTSTCVYWNFDDRDGIGDWAEDGCVVVEADSEGITCHCNHLTNFAVLVDFAGQSEPGTLTFALDIISKIGCAFSIGALCLTLMIFILSSRLRISLQRKILIQFCISMLCLYLAFLLGIDSGTDAGCTAATFLLHYFVLTTVFWMGVEARHMYITLVSKSDRVGRKFMIKASLFAWGAALIPVGVVLGVKWDAYQAEGYCFIVPDYGLYFGLLLPVGLVVLHNVATFVFVAKKLLSSKLYVVKKDLAAGASPPDVKEIAQRMINAFSVSMLLGITWIFGFLAIDEVRFAFQLIFCICNSFQGVMIFILFCLAQKDVRRLLGDKFRSKSSSKSRPTKKQKQLAMTPVKARKDAPVTSISDSTRVSGEIYSEDSDTVVTNLDNDTMTINTMDSSELSD